MEKVNIKARSGQQGLNSVRSPPARVEAQSSQSLPWQSYLTSIAANASLGRDVQDYSHTKSSREVHF